MCHFLLSLNNNVRSAGEISASSVVLVDLVSVSLNFCIGTCVMLTTVKTRELWTGDSKFKKCQPLYHLYNLRTSVLKEGLMKNKFSIIKFKLENLERF